MEEIEKPSVLMRVGSPIFFIGLTLASLYLFATEVISTTGQLLSQPESISFNKGAYYLLGVGLGVGALTIGTVTSFWFGKTLSQKTVKLLMKVAVGCIALMLIVPQFVHYEINRYLVNVGYDVCEPASHQWLHSRTIVYVKNAKVCTELGLKR